MQNDRPREDPAALWEATLEVVQLLVSGDYFKAAQISRGVRLSADELRRAVHVYGRPLQTPPSPNAARFSSLQIQDANPPAWAISCDLWSSGEPSDLTLELTLRGPIDGPYDVEIDDLHVL